MGTRTDVNRALRRTKRQCAWRVVKNLHYRVVETTRLHSRGSVVARKTSANGHPIDRLVSRSSLWLGRRGEALGNKFRWIRKWLMTFKWISPFVTLICDVIVSLNLYK